MNPNSRVINTPRGSVTFKDTTKIARCAGCGGYTANFVIYDGGAIEGDEQQRIGIALCFYNEAKIRRGSPFLVPDIGGADPVAYGCSAEYRDWQIEELKKGDIKTPPRDMLPPMLKRWLLEKKGRRVHFDNVRPSDNVSAS